MDRNEGKHTHARPTTMEIRAIGCKRQLELVKRSHKYSIRRSYYDAFNVVSRGDALSRIIDI